MRPCGFLFTDRDTFSSQRVALINERAVLRMFPNEYPIGKRIHITNQRGTVWRDVVGVVGDTKQYGRDAANTRQVYEPYFQKPSDTMTLMVRTSGDPLKLANAVTRTGACNRSRPARRRNPDHGGNCQPLHRRSAILDAAVRRVRRTRLVAGSHRNIRCDGVRSGATHARDRRSNGRSGAALGLSRVLKTQLYEVSPTDPLVFSDVILLLLGVALLATLIPALCATTVDPIRALRQD